MGERINFIVPRISCLTCKLKSFCYVKKGNRTPLIKIKVCYQTLLKSTVKIGK